VATVRTFGVGMVFMVLLVSAVAVIYYQYRARLLFIDIQQQENTLDRYETEWGQMQLELTMLAEQNRIESVAIKQLKLVMPKREEIIYIKP
jgi:cell division protein FtsL